MMLLVLNVFMLAYLINSRPYIVRSLQWIETACHTIELALTSCACALLFGETMSDNVVYGLQWSLLGEWVGFLWWKKHSHNTLLATGSFASTALTLVMYEVWKILGYAKALLAYVMKATQSND